MKIDGGTVPPDDGQFDRLTALAAGLTAQLCSLSTAEAEEYVNMKPTTIHVSATYGQDPAPWTAQARSVVYAHVVMTPEIGEGEARASQKIMAVLDRSGSMHGHKLEDAKRALEGIVDGLTEQDQFGLIIFDGSYDVLQPPVYATAPNKVVLKAHIARIESRGFTQLSRPFSEALRLLGSGGTVLFVTDGHSTVRPLEDDTYLRSAAEDAARQDTRVVTIGIGERYNHALLQDVVRSAGPDCEHFHITETAKIGEVVEEVLVELSAGGLEEFEANLTFGAGIEALEVVSLVPVQRDVEVGPNGCQIKSRRITTYRAQRLLLKLSVGTSVPGHVVLGTLSLKAKPREGDTFTVEHRLHIALSPDAPGALNPDVRKLAIVVAATRKALEGFRAYEEERDDDRDKALAAAIMLFTRAGKLERADELTKQLAAMQQGGAEGDGASWEGESGTLREGLESSMDPLFEADTGPSDLESSSGGAP